VPGHSPSCRRPHTLGHCALHLADRDVVIARDPLVTLDAYTGRTGPRLVRFRRLALALVARAATVDSERNRASLDAVGATGARIVLTGHGEPWTSGAAAAVAAARAAAVA
jgi:glyoxylase-like metal-dependent hydrolase (beta-lactamase superfamily II)